jgi:choline dehydrogenase
VSADHNGYRQEGFHVGQSFIADGVRWSSSRAYLRPDAGRPNLHVMKGATVRRVLFEDGAVPSGLR